MLPRGECRDWADCMGRHSTGVRLLPYPLPIQQPGSSCILSTSPEAFWAYLQRQSQDCCCSNTPASLASAPLLLLQIVICSILSWSLAPACPGPAQIPQLVAGAALTWVRRMRRKRPFLTGQVMTSDNPKPSSSATDFSILCMLMRHWGAACTCSDASGIWNFQHFCLLCFSCEHSAGFGHEAEALPPDMEQKNSGDMAESSMSSALPVPRSSCTFSWACFKCSERCKPSCARALQPLRGSWLGPQVGWLCCCSLVDGQMVPSGWLTAPKPVCQEPIDFPEGWQIFSLCTNT